MTTGDSPTSGPVSGPYKGWPPHLHVPPGKRRARRGKKKGLGRTPPISITSLTDMVTMLLVYLLSTFATNPVEVKETSVQIPRSVCVPDEMWDKDHPDEPPPDGCGKIQETTLVMITGPEMRRTVDNVQRVQRVTPRILINNRPLVELDPATYRVPDKEKDPASGYYVITSLREALKREREIKEVTAQLTGKKFDGKVIILADKHTPYRVLTDVLVTCGESGFADFRFAVIRPE